VRDPSLRGELEAALDLNVRRVNPADRANRFGSGAAVEWILAAAAYAGGVLTLPGGHNANGFDRRDLRDDARGLWSVKNTTSGRTSGSPTAIGGAEAGFTDPVVFLSPALPGLTLIHPHLHADVTVGCGARRAGTGRCRRRLALHVGQRGEGEQGLSLHGEPVGPEDVGGVVVEAGQPGLGRWSSAPRRTRPPAVREMRFSASVSE
jgi:hypothetical protein